MTPALSAQVNDEPHAVLLVEELRGRFGASAVRVAVRQRDLAEQQGLIGNVDLYHAACVILYDRQNSYRDLRRA